MKFTALVLSVLFLSQQLFSTELEQPNIIVLMTDQERHPMDWPAGWVKKHLPSQGRLMEHGLSFERAYTSACMCSPSRAALLTSQYSIVNDVSKTRHLGRG